MFIIQHKIIYFVKSILYGKSQYVLGENLWNDLPLDIQNTAVTKMRSNDLKN